jgi:hypothetical protein
MLLLGQRSRDLGETSPIEYHLRKASLSMARNSGRGERHTFDPHGNALPKVTIDGRQQAIEACERVMERIGGDDNEMAIFTHAVVTKGRSLRQQ